MALYFKIGDHLTKITRLFIISAVKNENKSNALIRLVSEITSSSIRLYLSDGFSVKDKNPSWILIAEFSLLFEIVKFVRIILSILEFINLSLNIIHNPEKFLAIHYIISLKCYISKGYLSKKEPISHILSKE